MAKKKTPPPIKTIGFLHSGTQGKHDKEYNEFKKFLKNAGDWGLHIIERWANDDLDLLRTHAQTLAGMNPMHLIVAAGGSASARAAAIATNAGNPANPIPVVFTSYFEVNRPPMDSTTTTPAMNCTGVCARTSELDSDRLGQLHNKFPNEQFLGALVNSDRFDYPTQMLKLRGAAAGMHVGKDTVQLILKDVKSDNTKIEPAFQDWQNNKPAPIVAAIVTADPFFNDYRKEVTKAAQKYGIQAIYQWHEFIDDADPGPSPGWSYGTSLMEAYQKAGTIAGTVLNGTQPGDITVVPLTNISLRAGREKSPRKTSSKKSHKPRK